MRRNHTEGVADMGKYVRWIEYRGQKILYSDYSGLRGAEYEVAVDETV